VDAESLSRRWILAAVTYFVIGVAFGVYMGASGSHAMFSVHSHLSLLGWTSMGLTGLLYRYFPGAARTRLAAWHFWSYQLSLPAMLLGLVALHSGLQAAEPIVGIASLALLVSVVLFWWTVASRRSAGAPQAG
jgi:hypothetical protein